MSTNPPAVLNPGQTNRTDGDETNPPGLGKQGDAYVSQYHGQFYHAAYRDKLFHGCSVVGGNSFPIYTATAFVFGLWNKSAEVNLELISFKAAYVSGTGVAGPFGYMTKDVGLAVGVPLAAFNHVATGIRPGRLYAGGTSKAGFSNAATNTIVAGAAADFIPGNMYQPVVTAADATQGPTTLEERFDGSIIIPPGTLFWPAALLASVSLYTMRLTWIETAI